MSEKDFCGFCSAIPNIIQPSKELRNKRNKTPKFFENSFELITPEQAAEMLNLSVTTIYGWKYKSAKLNVPDGLFIKFQRRLYLRIEVLKAWVTSQNSSDR